MELENETNSIQFRKKKGNSNRDKSNDKWSEIGNKYSNLKQASKQTTKNDDTKWEYLVVSCFWLDKFHRKRISKERITTTTKTMFISFSM